MKLAIVGSTMLAGNKTAESLILAVIDRYKPEAVVSGGAVGIDSMAEYAAKNLGIPTIIFLPKVKNWQDGFKPRNLQIAKECDVLVRIAAKGSKTYGSGWTRDQAAKMGKETVEYLLDGEFLVVPR